jgi:ketosteroid isomerase-like protein
MTRSTRILMRVGIATSASCLLLAACEASAVAQQPTEAEFRALQAQFRELRDREEIRALIIEYGHLLDTRDFVGYANLFAKNGEWIGGFGRAEGPKAILALMYKYMGKAPFDPRNVKGFHLLTNFVIHVDGDRATATTKLVFMSRNKDNKPTPAMGGHYDDVLIRENGHWKFLRRVVMMDIPFQDPREIKGEPPPAPIDGP